MKVPLLVLTVLLTRTDADDVLDLASKITYRIAGKEISGQLERAPAARRIASAIADVADGSITGDLITDRALFVVYAAFEGGFRLCPRGDGGKSLGTWQLQGQPPSVACDPPRAARAWLSLARYSVEKCAGLSEEERLALLASGSCDRGRALVRERFLLARRIAREVTVEDGAGE